MIPAGLSLKLSLAPPQKVAVPIGHLIFQAQHICRVLELADVQFEFEGGLCVVLAHGTGIFWASGTEKVGEPRVWRDGAWEEPAA